jgi:hypothetical protein
MLTLVPRITERLWVLFAADTSPDWLEPGGRLRSAGAGHWVALSGGLSSAEADALRALRVRLGQPDRHAIARRVYAAAAAELAGWEGAVRDPTRPEWFAPMHAALVRFMGADPDRSIAVHLLPSDPQRNGRTWATFVGVGHRTLQCGGPASRPDGLLEDLLHGAAHGAQPARLDPLIDTLLATAEGRALDAQFRATPYGLALRDIPEIEDAGLRDLLGEYVVHALAYQGALREMGGLPALDDYWRNTEEAAHRALADPAAAPPPGGQYAVWVLGGCAALQPATREYLLAGRPLDGAYLRHAVAVYEDLYDRWRRGVQAAGDAAHADAAASGAPRQQAPAGAGA